MKRFLLLLHWEISLGKVFLLLLWELSLENLLSSSFLGDLYTTYWASLLKSFSFFVFGRFIFTKIQMLGLGHSLAAVDSSTGDLLGVSIMTDRQKHYKHTIYG